MLNQRYPQLLTMFSSSVSASLFFRASFSADHSNDSLCGHNNGQKWNSSPMDLSPASRTSYSLHSRRRSRRLWFVLSNISIFSSNNSCCRPREAECSFDRRFSWKLNAVSLILIFALLMDAEEPIQGQTYLGKAVNGSLQSRQLIGYGNTVDFCFYQRPEEHVCISVLTARVRPVKNRNMEITKTFVYSLLMLHGMYFCKNDKKHQKQNCSLLSITTKIQ